MGSDSNNLTKSKITAEVNIRKTEESVRNAVKTVAEDPLKAGGALLVSGINGFEKFRSNLGNAALGDAKAQADALVTGTKIAAAVIPASRVRITPGVVNDIKVVSTIKNNTQKMFVPSANTPSSIIFGELDALGRPSGISAIIRLEDLGTGTKASQRIKPPGFAGGVNNHARGHLLANILGGSGSKARNLVTLFQRNTNTPNMRNFERQVQNAVKNGEVVNYNVIPVYSGNNLVPTGVTLRARGSNGFSFDVSIENVNAVVK